MKVRLFTIPNLLTLANLVCGSVGVVMALSGGRLTTAFCLMILAAVFDFFDGFVARLLGQSSPIGLQLDSLSDDISFGLLPASILYVLYGRMPSLWLGEGPAAEAAAYAVFRRRGLRGAASGEVQYRRHAAHGVLRPALAGRSAALRVAGAAGRAERTRASARGGPGRGRGVADGLRDQDVRAQVPRLRLAGATSCAIRFWRPVRR